MLNYLWAGMTLTGILWGALHGQMTACLLYTSCTDNLYRLAEYMDSAMAEFFKTYLAMSDEELREHRYQRFRRM